MKKTTNSWYMSFSKNTPGSELLLKVFHMHENGNLHSTNKTNREADSSDAELVVYKCIECQAEASLSDYGIFNASGILKEFKRKTP